MKKKWAALLALATVGALGLAACEDTYGAGDYGYYNRDYSNHGNYDAGRGYYDSNGYWHSSRGSYDERRGYQDRYGRDRSRDYDDQGD